MSYDIANFNLVNWANATPDLYDSAAKNVDIIQKDDNGNIYTKTIANRGMFKQQLWDDVGGALGQFNRTFYVDADNGDDNNDGSSGNPFKSLQKAVDSVPISGFGCINLVSDYTGSFNVNLKTIYMSINAGKVWTIPMGDRCDITGSNVGIYNQGNLIVDKGDGSDITAENYAGFWVSDSEYNIFLGIIANLCLINNKATNPVRIDSDRSLFGVRNSGMNQNIQINLVVYNIYTNGNFTLDGNLMQLNNGCGSFQWNNFNNDSSFQVIDSSGNAVDVKTKIAGIIKDSNSVPRNVISNIIL